MDKNCDFCQALKFQNIFWSANHEIRSSYTAALVTRSWTDAKGEDRASRTTDYRDQGKGYPLNFCPECGRKLDNNSPGTRQ